MRQLAAQNPQAASLKLNQTKSSHVERAVNEDAHLNTHAGREGFPRQAVTGVHVPEKHVGQTAHARSHACTHTTDHNMQASEEIY